MRSLPLGKKPRTLTTTRTLPPGSILLPTGVTLPSLDRRDGVDAEDRSSAATPGINRGSKAMSINWSCRLCNNSTCRRRQVEYMNLETLCLPMTPKRVAVEKTITIRIVLPEENG